MLYAIEAVPWGSSRPSLAVVWEAVSL